MASPIRASALWKATATSLRLSPREEEIVVCLLELDDDEARIAARLERSNHTVHTHLQRLYKKLGVNTRSQLLARVFARYAELVECHLALRSSSSSRKMRRPSPDEVTPE